MAPQWRASWLHCYLYCWSRRNQCIWSQKKAVACTGNTHTDKNIVSFELGKQFCKPNKSKYRKYGILCSYLGGSNMVKWGLPEKTIQFTRIDLMSIGPPMSSVQTKPNFGAISPSCKTENQWENFVYASLNHHFCGGSPHFCGALVQKSSKLQNVFFGGSLREPFIYVLADFVR